MKEIKMLSRGGQGAVTAAKILVAAAIEEEKYGQAIPNFGQERKGAPVFTYARLDEAPISTHTYVYRPHAVVLFDLTLLELGIDPAAGLRPEAILVANTPERPDAGHPWSAFSLVAAVDAWQITKEILGPVPPNAAMLGAFARATGWVGIDAVCAALVDSLPGDRGAKNAVCARAAYERTMLNAR